eukprot:TRINITY_DN121156_c0_g1_i1.p1 TRINITY_DN121156_c0_g1~~TRINITY_DN121156_c0_g1_i1.p1  ORF type:complete len:403 (-),score=120.78 TRINITY_DN121156_c0_g1_i1:165-1373(-)
MAASSSAPTARIQLSFGGERVEVDATWASRRGGLRAFAREAETHFGLLPNTFGFSHGTDKVDSFVALQTSMKNCSDDAFLLEVRERPEAQTMRKVSKALEDRIMARVEQTLVQMQKQIEQTDLKVTRSIAPMVRNLANEQIDIREKLEEMNNEAFESRQDLVQGLDELEQKLDALSGEALECRIDSIASFEAMEKKLSDVARGLLPSSEAVVTLPALSEAATGALKQLEDICLEASKETALQAAADMTAEADCLRELDDMMTRQAEHDLESMEQTLRDSLATIQAEVRGLAQPVQSHRPSAVDSSPSASKKAARVEEASHFVKMVVPAAEAAQPAMGQSMFGAISFGSKMSLEPPGVAVYGAKKAPAGLSPAAMVARPRASGRMTSYSSMPLLPPLQSGLAA